MNDRAHIILERVDALQDVVARNAIAYKVEMRGTKTIEQFTVQPGTAGRVLHVTRSIVFALFDGQAYPVALANEPSTLSRVLSAPQH